MCGLSQCCAQYMWCVCVCADELLEDKRDLLTFYFFYATFLCYRSVDDRPREQRLRHRKWPRIIFTAHVRATKAY